MWDMKMKLYLKTEEEQKIQERIFFKHHLNVHVIMLNLLNQSIK